MAKAMNGVRKLLSISSIFRRRIPSSIAYGRGSTSCRNRSLNRISGLQAVAAQTPRSPSFRARDCRQSSMSEIRHTLTVPDESAGHRLDQVLAGLLAEYSRTRIKEWIESGHVLVNGS